MFIHVVVATFSSPRLIGGVRTHGFAGQEIPAVCRHADPIHTSGEASAVVINYGLYMTTHEDQQEARKEQVRGEELSTLWGSV